MSVGLFENGEPQQEFTEEELSKISINPPVRREDKKTKKQRRKEQERKEQVSCFIWAEAKFVPFEWWYFIASRDKWLFKLKKNNDIDVRIQC